MPLDAAGYNYFGFSFQFTLGWLTKYQQLNWLNLTQPTGCLCL
jgi:hypothetical protein